MKFIAAYLLAQLGSASAASPPGKADVLRILESVGVEVEGGRMDMLFAELEGKDFAELIAVGRERLAYAPCAGTGMAGVAAAPAGAGAGEAKEEEEKEEEKVVEEEEDDLVFSLFDDE